MSKFFGYNGSVHIDRDSGGVRLFAMGGNAQKYGFSIRLNVTNDANDQEFNLSEGGESEIEWTPVNLEDEAALSPQDLQGGYLDVRITAHELAQGPFNIDIQIQQKGVQCKLVGSYHGQLPDISEEITVRDRFDSDKLAVLVVNLAIKVIN